MPLEQHPVNDEPDQRFALPRYRRFRRDPPPAISPDDPDYYYPPTTEDFLPSPRRPRSPLSIMPDRRHLKSVLFCFVLFWAVSVHDWRHLGPTNFMVSAVGVFQRHEYWRLFTALFDHLDLGHIAANTPLFLIFGWYLRAYFGRLAFPGAAFLIGALSNAATIYFYPPEAELLGASGMLYGMVALWLVLYVRFESEYSVGYRIFRAIGVSLLLLFPTTFEAAVSYLAHATGFGIGLAMGFVIMPFVHLRSDAPAPVSPTPSKTLALVPPLPPQAGHPRPVIIDITADTWDTWH